jgi:hypothetical protein
MKEEDDDDGFGCSDVCVYAVYEYRLAGWVAVRRAVSVGWVVGNTYDCRLVVSPYLGYVSPP